MFKIIGYQWGDRNQFIGQYEIHTLKEDSLHLPPNTTLIVPPSSVPDNKEAIWNNEIWELKDKPEPLSVPQPIIEPVNIVEHTFKPNPVV